MQEFIQQATAKYQDRFDFSRAHWSGPRGKLTIGCKQHDAEFEQNPAAFLKQPGCKQCADRQKTEEFIVKAQKIHGNRYDYTHAAYTASNAKLTIICALHGQFLQSPNKHLQGKGCNSCGIINTADKIRDSKESFVEKAKKIHGEDTYGYDLVNYVNAATKVIIVCKIHGNFEQTPNTHLNGSKCRKCSFANIAKLHTKDQNAFIERAAVVHGNKYDYSLVKYESSHKKVIIVCKIHGRFEQAAGSHLNGCGCPKCALIDASSKHRGTRESFIEKAVAVHGMDKYVYDLVNYVGSTSKVIITCKAHGNFEISPNTHLQGQGCKKCTNKRGNNTSKTTQQFIEEARTCHGDRYDYSRTIYTKALEKITIGCNEHGFFEQIANEHLRGRGCRLCGRITTADKSRHTAEMFIESAKLKHNDPPYDYSKVIYVGSSTNVIITCKFHGDFEQTPSAHISGQRCPKCAYESAGSKLRATRSEFIEKCILTHGDKYDYSRVEYVDSTIPIIIVCKIHGEFSQKPASHTQGKGCRACGTIQTTQKRRYNTTSFIEKALIVHNGKYAYDNVDYINSSTKVVICCKIHGNFEQIPADHLSGLGCIKCGLESSSAIRAGTMEQFMEASVLVHGNKYDYANVIYVNTNTKVNIVCSVHGVFIQKPSCHINGQGCPNCKHKTESKLLEWLQIEFDPTSVQSQVSFEECKKESTGRCYRYDFRVGNTIIELDGAQHFQTVSHWNSRPEESLANDTHKARLITDPNGLNLNLIRIYQPWVAADSNNWQEQLYRAIVSLEHLRGQVIYIGGEVYDRHRAAYDGVIEFASDSADISGISSYETNGSGSADDDLQ